MQRVRLSSEQAPVHKLGDSQTTLTRKFRLAVTPRAPVSRSPEKEPLIPGLPDDVALSCLLRLPVEAHSRCRAVSKRWRTVLATKELFFTARAESGFTDPWLFVLAYHNCTADDKIRWHVLSLAHFAWHDVPAMPPLRDKDVCPHGLRSVSVPEHGALFVSDGSDSLTKFEIRRNRWSTVKTRMSEPRSRFASGVINGTVYVAGGIGNGNGSEELDSAEAFDTERGVWSPVARMGARMATYDSAILGGKLFATEGWAWPFYCSPMGQMYDPRGNAWAGMAVGMREGWTGLSAVVQGRLFVVSEVGRTRVNVYNEDCDSWESVEGGSLPEQIRKPFAVSSFGSTIFVVGLGLCVAVGLISRTGPENQRFGLQWWVVEAPERLSGLKPSGSQVLVG